MTTNSRYHQRRRLEAWCINSAYPSLNGDYVGLSPEAYLHLVNKVVIGSVRVQKLRSHPHDDHLWWHRFTNSNFSSSYTQGFLSHNIVKVWLIFHLAMLGVWCWSLFNVESFYPTSLDSLVCLNIELLLLWLGLVTLTLILTQNLSWLNLNYLLAN